MTKKLKKYGIHSYDWETKIDDPWLMKHKQSNPPSGSNKQITRADLRELIRHVYVSGWNTGAAEGVLKTFCDESLISDSIIDDVINKFLEK
jgi:hypothetical protein